jgi:5-methylcytosine-specific restriction endonuclease McrA
VEKPRREFGKRSKATDGLNPWCKACRKEYGQRPEVKLRNREAARKIRATPEGREKHRDNLRRLRSTPEGLEKARASVRAADLKRKNTPERKANKLAGERRRYSTPAGRLRHLAKAHCYNARKLSAPGPHHTAADRKRIFAEHGGLCFWCQQLGLPPAGATELDHVIPLVRGGSNGPENLVPACKSCNSSKQAKLPEEFLARRRSFLPPSAETG